MNNSQKNSKFSKVKKMLSQMPGGIGKKIFLFGLPIVSAILVVAVVATSILVNSTESKAEFGKVEKEKIVEANNVTETKSLQTAQVKAKAPEIDILEKDLAQIKRDSDAFALQDLIESGTGVELKEEDTLSISEIQAATRTESDKAPPAENNKVVESDSSQNADDIGNDNSGNTETPDEEGSDFVDSWTEKYVNTQVLNIRETPSFSAKVIGTLEQGDLVTETVTNYEWSEILLSNNQVGYVYNPLLTTDYVAPQVEAEPEETVDDSAFTPTSGTMYVKVSAGANLRSEANTDSKVNATLYCGATVYLNSYAAPWYFVTDAAGNSGYIREDLLSSTPISQDGWVDVNPDLPDSAPEPAPAPTPVDPVAPGNSGGVAAAQIAASKAGAFPYKHGAAGPNAFDCSGLVQFAVTQAGGYISRTAASQAGDGIAVPFSYGDYSALAPGDVLCFASGGGITHSGMYIGAGQFVHAMNEIDGIQINALGGQWASMLAHVRRVFY